MDRNTIRPKNRHGIDRDTIGPKNRHRVDRDTIRPKTDTGYLQTRFNQSTKKYLVNKQTWFVSRHKPGNKQTMLSKDTIRPVNKNVLRFEMII